MPLLPLALVVVVLLSLAASVGWRLAGNTLFFDATPSMCPSLCVGSLVIDVPADGANLRVGETITFHPPGVSQVFTHRIVGIADGGQAISTEGTSAARPDPWVITPSDVEGVMVASVWGLGWFLRALPFMSIGVVILLLFRRYVSERSRRDMDRFFSVLLVVVPVAVMRPLVSAYTASVNVVGPRLEAVRVINTGLLPVQFRVTAGPTMSHVAPGRTATLMVSTLRGSEVPVHEVVSLGWLGWLVLLLAILGPAISFAVDLLRHHYDDGVIDDAGERDRDDCHSFLTEAHDGTSSPVACAPSSLPATTSPWPSTQRGGSLLVRSHDFGTDLRP